MKQRRKNVANGVSAVGDRPDRRLRFQALFAERGVEVIVAAPAAAPETRVAKYVAGPPDGELERLRSPII